MKANRLTSTVLLLLSAPVFQLSAQQNETDGKQFEELKAKAEAGDADSEYQLGFRYCNGESVPKDFSRAVKWFRKAAGQSNVQAETALGYCYATGQGVAKEHTEAAKWYRKAAEQNFAQA